MRAIQKIQSQSSLTSKLLLWRCRPRVQNISKAIAYSNIKYVGVLAFLKVVLDFVAIIVNMEPNEWNLDISY